MKSIKRLQVAWREPVIVVRQLVDIYGEKGLVWLDGDGSDLGRSVTLGLAPLETVRCSGLPGEKGASNPFEALSQLSNGHWTGWLSYEAAAWLEPENPWSKDAVATLWIARHDPTLRFDLQLKTLWIEGTDIAKIKTIETVLSNAPIPKERRTKSIPIHTWKQHTNQTEFTDGVRHIRNLIANGDIFQANLTACYSTTLPKDTNLLELYVRIRQHCPAPFSGLVITDQREAVLCSSPERFMAVDCSGRVQTRPIKGTRPRHSDQKQDADLAAELVCSEKDRAENVMIVDILRNDLGRVCAPGSISVPQLLGLESYASVHHLTSIVEGQLKQGLTWVDVLKACWPGGSISGAPKLRACQRLNELEPTSRGPYCGSIIHIDWDGRFDSNIVIRSLIQANHNLRAHAGCGIVAESNPDGEAEEMKWKLRPLLEALSCQ